MIRVLFLQSKISIGIIERPRVLRSCRSALFVSNCFFSYSAIVTELFFRFEFRRRRAVAGGDEDFKLVRCFLVAFELGDVIVFDRLLVGLSERFVCAPSRVLNLDVGREIFSS